MRQVKLRPSSSLQCYPSWREGLQVAHGPQPDSPWGLSYDEDKVTAELQTGIDSSTSEGADEAVGPGSDLREALGDPADELICDASRPAHQVDVEHYYVHLASTACHVGHKSPLQDPKQNAQSISLAWMARKATVCRGTH